MTETQSSPSTEETSEVEAEATPRAASGLRGHVGLLATLLGAAALAVFAQRSGGTRPELGASRESAANPEHAASAREPSVTSGNPLAPTISGRILERLDVPNYTYLALDTGTKDPTWVAVTTTSVSVGDSVRVLDAQLMTNFTSASLKRTFATIYFGMLDQGGTSRSGADPHAGVPGAPPLAGNNPHGGANAHGGTNPHAGIPGASSSSVAVGSVPKAEGPNGRTVRETFQERAALAGKSVRLRGVVVKVVSGVLGRTFVHLRDGSEPAELGDLLVTTQATPAVGERVLVEGKVTVDKDFGAGYAYPVLLEDAVLIQ